MLLNVCYITEDETIIERALRQAKTLMNPQVLLFRYHIERAEDVLSVMRGKPPPETTIEERLIGPRDGEMIFDAAVNRAHVLRLAGDPRAPDMMLHAARKLDEYSGERTPLPVMVALHLKNVLAGIPKNTRNRKHRALREKAEAICRERIQRGFGLLRLLAHH
jgi:hypothetical protein